MIIQLQLIKIKSLLLLFFRKEGLAFLAYCRG
jgi:hypothetical protein